MPDVKSLSDIVRGMQHAINTAQEIVEQHYLRVLHRYFDEENNPIMVTFNLPPDKIIKAPLIALIDQKSLTLDEVCLEMAVRIDGSVVKKVPTLGEPLDLERASFSVSFAPQKSDMPREEDIIDVIMKFKAGDPPEGVARIMDEFTATILPEANVALRERSKSESVIKKPLKKPKPKPRPKP